jgi:hypothetical protein
LGIYIEHETFGYFSIAPTTHASCAKAGIAARYPVAARGGRATGFEAAIWQGFRRARSKGIYRAIAASVSRSSRIESYYPPESLRHRRPQQGAHIEVTSCGGEAINGTGRMRY